MTKNSAKLCVFILCLCAACGAPDPEAEPVPQAEAVEAALDELQATSSAPMCAIDYARCLLRAPLGVEPCTAKAEDCGLFDGVLDAGTSTVSASCALRMAECVARNPFRASICTAMCQ